MLEISKNLSKFLPNVLHGCETHTMWIHVDLTLYEIFGKIFGISNIFRERNLMKECCYINREIMYKKKIENYVRSFNFYYFKIFIKMILFFKMSSLNILLWIFYNKIFKNIYIRKTPKNIFKIFRKGMGGGVWRRIKAKVWGKRGKGIHSRSILGGDEMI